MRKSHTIKKTKSWLFTLKSKIFAGNNIEYPDHLIFYIIAFLIIKSFLNENMDKMSASISASSDKLWVNIVVNLDSMNLGFANFFIYSSDSIYYLAINPVGVSNTLGTTGIITFKQLIGENSKITIAQVVRNDSNSIRIKIHVTSESLLMIQVLRNVAKIGSIYTVAD